MTIRYSGLPYRVGTGLVAAGLLLVVVSLIMVADNWWMDAPAVFGRVGASMILVGGMGLAIVVLQTHVRSKT